MIAISGEDEVPLDRQSTAPAARTALLTGAVSGALSFGTSTPAGHPGIPHASVSVIVTFLLGVRCSPRIVTVTDVGGVPSATPDGRVRCAPLAATRSSDRRRQAPST